MSKKIIALLALLSIVPAAFAADWETDFEKAAARAKAENKVMLLDFTGSDWCSWCMKLDKEIFGKKEFKQFAATNLVLVTLDFPQQKPQSKKLKKQNTALAAKYHVSGYPTVILLGPDGDTVVGQPQDRLNGPAPFIREIQGLLAQYRQQHPDATLPKK